MDISALARANYDPGRFSTAYHREKKQLKRDLGDALAAQGAAKGSSAAANDPTRWGSAARQNTPQLFAPQRNQPAMGSGPSPGRDPVGVSPQYGVGTLPAFAPQRRPSPYGAMSGFNDSEQAFGGGLRSMIGRQPLPSLRRLGGR